MHTFLTTNDYLKALYGKKVYKLSLSAATTCPNRDGTISEGGCTFCSAGGSGDFASSAYLPLAEQLAQAKARISAKASSPYYIAYFQSYTGTYGDLEYLESIYQQACAYPEIVGLSIATRPDCLGPEALAMLERLATRKPLWVELGLQTIHETTAKRINRGYQLAAYDEAMNNLAKLGVHRITHVILGLPGETREDMLATVRYVGQRTDGIKLQLLHVLKNTALAHEYLQGGFKTLEPEEYYNLVADCLEELPEQCVIHRLTGDGPKKDLIAPLWSGDKKRVMADLQKVLRKSGIVQKVYNKNNLSKP